MKNLTRNLPVKLILRYMGLMALSITAITTLTFAHEYSQAKSLLLTKYQNLSVEVARYFEEDSIHFTEGYVRCNAHDQMILSKFLWSAKEVFSPTLSLGNPIENAFCTPKGLIGYKNKSAPKSVWIGGSIFQAIHIQDEANNEKYVYVRQGGKGFIVNAMLKAKLNAINFFKYTKRELVLSSDLAKSNVTDRVRTLYIDIPDTSFSIKVYIKIEYILLNLIKSAQMVIFASCLHFFFVFFRELCKKIPRKSRSVNKWVVDGQLRDLFYYYQPIVDFKTKEIIGLESLMRFRKEGKAISIGDYIEELEQRDDIFDITKSMITKSQVELRDLLKDNPSLTVSYNIPPFLFEKEKFFEFISNDINNKEQIALEITERGSISDFKSTQKMIEQYREIGVAIYLDDAGTGFSSNAYLLEMEFDVIKIDRMFVNSISSENTAVLDNMINMCQGLGADIIAEGVESIVEATELCKRGVCNQQGYFHSKPLSIDKLELLFKYNEVYFKNEIFITQKELNSILGCKA